MIDQATQKLPRGVSHNVGAQRYEKVMPLDMFKALPEKIQGKIKAALKKEEDAAAAVDKSNESQAKKTEIDQARVAKEKDDATSEKVSRRTGK